MSKILIFIDGANFYYGIREINKKYSDLRFNFERYIKEELLEKDDELLKVYYYNAPLKYKKEQGDLYSNQQRFFKKLETTKNFEVVLCRRQKRFDNNKKEYHIIKGDDIHLAVDLVKGVYETKVDKIILISGDGDFEPAIKLAKEKDKIVNLCYFEKGISKNIYNITNQKYLINKKILNKYFVRKNKN